MEISVESEISNSAQLIDNVESLQDPVATCSDVVENETQSDTHGTGVSEKTIESEEIVVETIDDAEMTCESSDSSSEENVVILDKEMSDAVLDAMNHLLVKQKGIDSSSVADNETLCVVSTNDLYKDGAFHCDKCSKKMKRKDNFKRHYWQIHKSEFTNSNIINNTKKNLCIFPGCEKFFYHKSRMVSHLENEHKVSVEIENKTFQNVDAFLKWKILEESENFVCFTKRDESKISKTVSYSSYVCQHDGTVKRTTPSKTATRKRKSVRKDLICPARMLVRRACVNNEVTVKYIKSHNHKIEYEDAKHYPLPISVKEEIKSKLLQNKTVDDVYSELHQEAHQSNNSENRIMALRKVLVRKNRIQYIQKKLNLTNKQNENKLLIEDRLKELTSKDYNPILLYKPEGLVVDDTSLSDIQGDNSVFIFAMQTKDQHEMFQEYAEKIVFLELTQPTVTIPYYILTLKVVDNLLQCYNVAHLITNVKDNDVACLFFNEIKIRCLDKNIKINIVMTTLDNYGVKSFVKVFGNDINFIYSKWYIHEMLFTKLLTDYPLEEELRHQVYFTLVALIEELDNEQFNSILSDFVQLYKDRCPVFVTYLVENYLNQPEKWALCYQDVFIRNCHIAMNGPILLNLLKSAMVHTKDVCSIDSLLHAILNVDQSNYLQQKCKRSLSAIPTSHHNSGLLIPDTDVSKISDSQWIILDNQKAYEVGWNADGCVEMFCRVRCLELVCFGLCRHMYTCSCDIRDIICLHVHKVHSLETGVCRFQVSCDEKKGKESAIGKREFTLYENLSAVMKVNKKVKTKGTIQKNLDKLQELVRKKDISETILSEINSTLSDIVYKTEVAIKSESNRTNGGKK